MKQATVEGIAKHLIRPANIIPTSRVEASCTQQIIIIHSVWKVLKIVEERTERRMMGKGMILVSIEVLNERIELIVLHPSIFVPMVAYL